MKYRLIDITSDTVQNVTTGTCEMCMRTFDLDVDYYVLEQEYGGIINVPGYYYDHFGTLRIEIDNVAHFASWLSQQDIQQPRVYDFFWLRDLVSQYDKQRESNKEPQQEAFVQYRIYDN